MSLYDDEGALQTPFDFQPLSVEEAWDQLNQKFFTAPDLWVQGRLINDLMPLWP